MAFHRKTGFDLSHDAPGPALLACPHCDLLQREAVYSTPCVVRCSRCGTALYRAIPGALDAALALTIAAAALFVVANAFPVMSLDLRGQEVSATLFDIAQALHGEGMTAVGVLVFFTLIMMPGLQIAARLYVLLPLRMGRVPQALAPAARVLDTMRRWSMVEVFVLAAVVCMHRLAQIAQLEVEPGFWAIGAVMLLFAATDSVFDARDVSAARAAMPLLQGFRGRNVMAAHAGLLNCELCGLLNRKSAAAERHSSCTRCGTALHARKPDSIKRTWALLIAAYVMYVPANILPVLETQAIGDQTTDTILGGAIRLWSQGAWPLSVVIIVASFAVPLAKMFVLTWLLMSTSGAPGNALRGTRLYRIVDFIGRWSMVDIYVGGLLVSLVQFHPFADVAVGPAAPAFAAVVVLTMLASRSFDPRLLWDAAASVRRGPDHG